MTLPALQLATRGAVAAALALTVAQALGLEFPLYAMIAAVIVTDLSSERTREHAWPRIAGTVIGTLTGAVLSVLLPAGPVAVGLAILVTMFLSHVLRFQSAAKLAGYVCGIVILDHHGEPWSYALLRFVETLIGIAAAVAVGFVPKMLPLRRSRIAGGVVGSTRAGTGDDGSINPDRSAVRANDSRTTGDRRHA